MEAIEAIKTRRSTRSYKPDPVPRKLLEEIIDACQWAGSPGNMQPWEFAILGGDAIAEFKKRLMDKVETEAPSELEFPNPLKGREDTWMPSVRLIRETSDCAAKCGR